MGAIAGYRMVARYPHYFAAFLPISGSCEADINNLTDTAIWAIHGESDGNIPASGARNTIIAVQRAGGNAFLTLLSMGHSGIQNYTFENELQYVDGEYYDPLTWCFRQSREA